MNEVLEAPEERFVDGFLAFGKEEMGKMIVWHGFHRLC
jgi:hypothetical protein